MLGFVIWHEQLVQQFLAVPPVARAHRRRLRHREQQLARLADHLTLFPRGQFHHRLRTLIPFLHQSPTLFRRRVQRQSHQRGARQQHQQQQAQSQTGNKPADDFSPTTIFHTKLDESSTARRVGAGLYPKKCPTMILAAGGTPTRAIRPTARLSGGSATTKVSRQRARTWYAGRTPDPQSTRRRLKRGN